MNGGSNAVTVLLLGWGALLCAAQSGAGSGVRVLKDPFTGQQWVVQRDPAHPGGPGRLVSVETIDPGGFARPAAAIVAGDRIIVEEHTEVLDARFEGTALERAGAGELLRVRLKIGSRVVNAVAIEHGRARLTKETNR